MVKQLSSIIFFFFSILISGYGQFNLVPNPSFEEKDSCPSGLAELTPTCRYWYDPISLMDSVPGVFYTINNWGTASYFHYCNQANVAIPINLYGGQKPRTDSAYAGTLLFAHISGLNVYKLISYVGIGLVEGLREDYTYYAEFYYSVADLSKNPDPNFFDDNLYFVELGMLFTEEPVKRYLIDSIEQPTNIYTEPQVKQMMGPDIDTVNWIKVSGTFVAKGGEKHLTIGSFKEIDTMYQNAYTYIFIDDVKVIAIDSVIPDPNAPITLYPNPAERDFWLERTDSTLRGCTLQLYDLAGREVYHYHIGQQLSKIRIRLPHLLSGMYLWRITEQGKEIEQGKVVMY